MGSLPEKVDLVVIGGGVGGYTAAIRAAELGMSVALVEKEKMGGACLNYACIPSKTMINIAKMYYDTKNAGQFGISGQLQLDANKIFEWRVGVSNKLQEGVIFLCKSNGVELVKGAATFTSSNKILITNGTEIEFTKAIIATGSQPTPQDTVPFGEGVLDYKQVLLLDYIPKSMTILGAGYVSVEVAMLFAKFGTKVNIIARSDLLSRFDREAVDVVKKKMQELGIKIYAGATVTSKEGKQLKLSTGETLDQEIIVVAVGLKPNTMGLGLRNTRVTLDDKGFVKVDSSLRTTDSNILAIGDVVGEPMLAHKAMRQGPIAAEVAYGMNSGFDNVVIPAVIFSDPEIAIAGILEGDGILTKKYPMSAVGRAIAVGKTEGFVKFAYTKDGIVKGVEIVGEDASSLISEATLAIEMGATLEDIASTIHPHPTFSEAIQEAAEAALDKPINFFYGKKPAQGTV